VTTDQRIAIAQYRVKAGGEEKFTDVLRRHSATLRSLGLISERPVEAFVGAERDVEGPLFVEIFEWADARAARLAHTHPQVTALWETIGELCESRGGRPMFEFPSVAPLDLS
jgi:hypothetical protein